MLTLPSKKIIRKVLTLSDTFDSASDMLYCLGEGLVEDLSDREFDYAVSFAGEWISLSERNAEVFSHLEECL